MVVWRCGVVLSVQCTINVHVSVAGVECLKYLLLDLRLNIRDDSGKTAFLIACSRDTCTKGIVQLLLDYSETKNIQLNVRDNNGMTGFMLSYQINILAAHLKRM